MILIMSFISSFEINKVNTFPALTAPFSLILFYLFIIYFFIFFKYITFKVKLLTNPGNLSLAKGIAIFLSAFFPK